MAEEKRDIATPRFTPGTIVTAPSLIVDQDGNAWWVRPDCMRIFNVADMQFTSSEDSTNG